MKRSSLLAHLRLYRCVLEREGAAPSLWPDPATRGVEAVPRHPEIQDALARKICRGLGVPEIGR